MNLKRKPLYSFKSDAKVGCTPLEIKFKATNGDPVDQIDYRWYFGDGEFAIGQDVAHTYFRPDRNYDLALNAVSTLTGCSDSLFNSKYVSVYPRPEAGFYMTPEVAYNDDAMVSFTDQSIDANKFVWDFGDGKQSTLQNPTHQFETVGPHIIVQTVFNQYNCADSASKVLMVALGKVYAPNAFSPKALNMIDREFKLYSNGVADQGYHLQIFSRWGEVVFECNNEIKAWNGYLSNGKMALNGTYIWILEFTDALGKRHKQKGTVLLVY